MLRWMEGLIAKIRLDEHSVCYARLLEFPLVAFYNGKFKTEIRPEEVLRLPILCKLWCHKSVLKIIEKVGYAELEQALREPVTFYKQDPITKRVCIYKKGKQYSATSEEIKGLECAAVWEPQHLLERLSSEFSGKDSKYKKSIGVTK